MKGELLILLLLLLLLELMELEQLLSLSLLLAAGEDSLLNQMGIHQ